MKDERYYNYYEMYVKEMNSANYIAGTQHCYSKEVMDAKEITNSVTICTTTRR